jgi:signal transduction histidine kinase
VANGQIQARYEINGRVVRSSNAVLSTSAEALAGEVIVLHNITDEVALDQAKTNLIALISHELRTPLTAIQSASDMLRKGIGGQLSPLQTELADTALRQTRAMSALIDKAIMVANIEADSLEIDACPTSLHLVVQAALGELRDTAAAAEVQLKVDLPSDLPLVLVDTRMLKVALQQVIDNAIKYGDGAPVQIVARQHAGGVALAVRDHGPGIAAEDLPNLFRPLRRGAGSLNAAPRGMGLGLVIARELIERQGGRISVQSQPGQGSLFSVFLPGASDGVSALAA